jgi:SAM-dependent methyltransferase
LKSTTNIWNEHYTRVKSRLLYPDENLVRILNKIEIKSGTALDFGAGSGRHSILLKNFGFVVTSVDYSENSLALIKELDPSINTVLASDPPYPFSDNSFDLIVSWGVLHYNPEQTIQRIIAEKHRILKKGGYLAGTIRADSDTFLGIKEGKISAKDLAGADANLYSKESVISFLSNFSSIQLGYMERTPIGKLEEKISHWIFLCRK